MKALVALATLLLLAPVAAAAAPLQAPVWTRSLPAGPPDAGEQVAIAGGSVALVRTGEALAGLNVASGKTRWTLPNVAGFAVAGDTLAVAGSGTVYVVRPSDAHVLWKAPCAPAAFLVAWPDRVATLCAGRITILRAANGSVIAARPLPHAQKTGYHAQALGASYLALSNDNDQQTGFTLVDARTAAVRWRKASSQIVAIGPSWVDLTPAHAPSLWAPPGTLERLDLAGGKLLGKHVYAFSVPVDEHGTLLYANRTAVYAYAGNGELYRSLMDGKEMERVTPVNGAVVGPTILGEAAFYGTSATNDAPTATVYVEHLVNGKPVERALGTFDNVAGQRVGNRVAFTQHGTVTFFDERGDAVAVLRTRCPKVDGIAAAAKRYVALCPTKTVSTVLGFVRR